HDTGERAGDLRRHALARGQEQEGERRYSHDSTAKRTSEVVVSIHARPLDVSSADSTGRAVPTPSARSSARVRSGRTAATLASLDSAAPRCQPTSARSPSQV